MEWIYRRSSMLKSDFNKVGFIKKLWHGCSPVNLVHIFRILFPKTKHLWSDSLMSDSLGGLLLLLANLIESHTSTKMQKSIFSNKSPSQINKDNKILTLKIMKFYLPVAPFTLPGRASWLATFYNLLLAPISSNINNKYLRSHFQAAYQIPWAFLADPYSSPKSPKYTNRTVLFVYERE